jgi:hypothetical protein
MGWVLALPPWPYNGSFIITRWSVIDYSTWKTKINNTLFVNCILDRFDLLTVYEMKRVNHKTKKKEHIKGHNHITNENLLNYRTYVWLKIQMCTTIMQGQPAGSISPAGSLEARRVRWYSSSRPERVEATLGVLSSVWITGVVQLQQNW